MELLKSWITARTVEQMDYDPHFPIHFLLEQYGDLRYHPQWIDNPYPTYRERFKGGSEPGYLIGEHIVDQLSGYSLKKINAVKVDYLNYPLNLKMYTGDLRRNQHKKDKKKNNHSWQYDVNISAKHINPGVAYLIIVSDWVLGRLRYFYLPTNYQPPRGGKGRSFILHREYNDLQKTDDNRNIMIEKIRNKGHILIANEYETLKEVTDLVKESIALPVTRTWPPRPV